MSSMRKLIEEKLESARVDLERTNDKYEKLSHEYKTAKKNDTAVFDLGIEVNKLYGESKKLIGCMQAYLDLLNLKELSEMEEKAEKYDEIKHIHEREMESTIDSYDKTLEKYERENKILKDGIKALYDGNPNINPVRLEFTSEQYKKIGAMLEVIKNE